jgi:glycine cleavage system regulatory protein
VISDSHYLLTRLPLSCDINNDIFVSKLSFSLCYRPGILADVTDRIARKGMSLEDVTTSIRLSNTGQREFVIDVLASSPNMEDKENLDQYIADITSMENDLKLSLLDIRVHTG